MMPKSSFFLFAFMAALFFACDEQRVYEVNTDIEETEWHKKDTLNFSFEIEDANQKYNLYYNVRYTNTYPFYNLFTKYFIYSDSTGALILSPEVPEDMYLFDVKTGVPLGSGVGDIYDQRIQFLKNYKFPATGKYHIKVLQYMRNDPLPGIVSFGIRVEKATDPSKDS